MFVNFNILNQLGSPAINSNTFANRPAAGQTGRLFVSTDTFEIYRDNGTTWDLIGGPGTSTITGTGTATQVAYFTSSQAIGSSSNLYWDNTNIRLGIGTNSPGARLDIHGSNVIAQFNGTTSASNSYIAFQRAGSNVWRVGDNYNSGDNFFELRNSVLSVDALAIQATTNKTTFIAQQNYVSGLAQGNLFTYNLTVPAGTTFTSPNALSAVNAYVNLSLGGNATLPAGTRQGIEGNSRISFTGAGTLTMSQGSTLRAYAAITGVHSFNGSAVGTITHLAGLRLCFPDNVGSAINVTNNYALLINDQTTGLGTVTYTNRWGIYQEGASDLNYLAANLLIGSTVNNGAALQVTGAATFSSSVTAGSGSRFIVPNSVLIGEIQSGYSLIESIGSNGIWLRPNGITSPGGMFLTTGGNVGINTTSPNYALEIRKSNGAWSTSDDTFGAVLGVYYNTANVGATQNRFNILADQNAVYLDGYDAYPIIFRNNGNTERMRITSGGNVLIGTTTDAGQKLQVNGSDRVVNLSGAGGGANSLLRYSDGSTAKFSSGLNNGNYIVYDDANSAYRQVLEASGNAEFFGSIKTAAPTTGTAGQWKLGVRVAATVALDTTQYIQLDIGGTLYKLAIVT